MSSYSWTKLLLGRSGIPPSKIAPFSLEKLEGPGILRLPKGKTASDICSDFLDKVFRFLIGEMELNLGKEIMLLTPIDL